MFKSLFAHTPWPLPLSNVLWVGLIILFYTTPEATKMHEATTLGIYTLTTVTLSSYLMLIYLVWTPQHTNADSLVIRVMQANAIRLAYEALSPTSLVCSTISLVAPLLTLIQPIPILASIQPDHFPVWAQIGFAITSGTMAIFNSIALALRNTTALKYTETKAFIKATITELDEALSQTASTHITVTSAKRGNRKLQQFLDSL